MSQKDKLVARIKRLPKDFTWDELLSLMGHLGYTLVNKGGSRRRFINRDTQLKILLHEPHPGNIVKEKALEEVVATLIDHGAIQED